MSSLGLRNSECARARFLSSISFCTADILAISLFEGPDKLLVSYGCYQGSDGLHLVISNILKFGERTECTPWKVLAYALKLVGHEDIDRHEDLGQERWVISCYKGQAVYPKVFETGNICQPGFLALRWAPGSLFFDGEIYDRGIGPVDRRLETDPVMTESPRTVTEPLNLYPSMRMEWKVVRYDGYLEIYLMCKHIIGLPSFILSSLAHALVISCQHDRASLLHRTDPNTHYIDLSFSVEHVFSTSDTERRIGVIAVDGNTDLRIFAMSVLPDDLLGCVVIRDNACLQCCLDLCREVGYRYVMC